VGLQVFFSGFSRHLDFTYSSFPLTPAQEVGTLMRKVGVEIKTVLSAITNS